MPHKVWAVGESVIADDLNTYIQKQVVSTHANAGSRSTAIPAPDKGQLTVLLDTNDVEIYSGTAWSRLIDKPSMRVHAVGTVPLNPGVDTLVPMSVTDFTRGGTTLTNSGITVPVAGLYHITGILGSANAAGNAGVGGSTIIQMTIMSTAHGVLARAEIFPSGTWANGTLSCDAVLNASETITFICQNTAGTIYIDPTAGLGAPCVIGAFLVAK